MDKVRLRAKLKKERNALHKKYILNRSVCLSNRIKKLIKRKRYIASYYPFYKEINPNISIQASYFPKITNKNTIQMCSKKEGFINGYKGIKEPFAKCIRIFKKELDAVIVPGIAFDTRGYRIGYGKGFYDKFLREFKGIKIGATFDCCIVEKIKNEKHDIPMDFVVSEKRSIVCKLRR